MKIWVDDIRTPPSMTNNLYDWVWFKSSFDTIEFFETLVEANKFKERYGVSPVKIEVMSLDHDLGGDDTTRPIVLWMCENDFWPVKTVVHSANPVGVEWLEGMIERYGP